MAKKIEVSSNITEVIKKRGRKSKKEIEQNLILSQNLISENINVIIEETTNNIVNVDLNNFISNDDDNDNNDNDNDNDAENIISENINIFSNENIQNEDSKPIAKKRGRKPKGGKIIQQAVSINNNKETKPNIILHLKCSLKDLQMNSTNNNIQGYNFNNPNNLSYDLINIEPIFNQTDNIINNTNNTNNSNNLNKVNDDDYDYDDDKSTRDSDIREVWRKLKVLEHNLHVNNISDKKSACFWCTYEFDNPPVYIPKHYIKNSYNVYGCFCSPECATAFLMEECIDSSSKFERYYLINHVYSKIYDYKKNIKPAPNPYYMLEKYYGNLTIQEYRALLRNERLFLIVDKPLTRILPELHEDNDDFIINNKIIPSNAYQIKKKLQKRQTKTNILSEKFGLSQQAI
jgi:hypothetical protein